VEEPASKSINGREPMDIFASVVDFLSGLEKLLQKKRLLPTSAKGHEQQS